MDDRDVLWNLANAALQLGDDHAQQHFYSYALSRAREAGAATAVVYCLQRLCFGHFLGGDHVRVRSSAEEAVALATGIGQPAMTALPTAWLAVLAALQDRDDYDELLNGVEELVAAHPLGLLSDPVHDVTRWAKGCARGDGRPRRRPAPAQSVPATGAGTHGRHRAHRGGRTGRRDRDGPGMG